MSSTANGAESRLKFGQNLWQKPASISAPSFRLLSPLVARTAPATLAMDVAEDGGLRPGYKLKLNSYDLGVDIELHDALQRIENAPK